MKADDQQSILRRLRSLEGHLKAVTAMIEKGENCDRVLHQLNAVQGALNAITNIFVRNQLAESEIIIKYSESPQERAQALDYLTLIYQWTFLNEQKTKFNSSDK